MPLIYIHGVRQRSPQGLERLRGKLEEMITRVRKRTVRIPAEFAVKAHHWGAFGVPDPMPDIIPAIGRLTNKAFGGGIQEGPSGELPFILSADVFDDLDDDTLAMQLHRKAQEDPALVNERIRRHAARGLDAAERAELELILAEPLGWERMYTESAASVRGPSVPDLGGLHALTGPLPDARDISFAPRRGPARVLQNLRIAVERTAVELALLTDPFRAWLGTTQGQLAILVGDLTKYVLERERLGRDSAILGPVIREIETDKDEPLIIITHSAGSLIAYDALTAYAPNRKVACLITVGGQIGQYHRLGLTKVALGSPKEQVTGLSPRIAAWHNYYDSQDPLCFLAGPVFKDAQDIEFSTGHGPSSAHGAYWKVPSFFSELEERIVDALDGA